MEFKDRLKQLRTEANLTSEELAKKIGVSRSAIGNYEIGMRIPRIDQLEAIADLFNVDMDFLLCRTDTIRKDSFDEERVTWLMKRLNDTGKREAVKRVEELTYIPAYTLQQYAGDVLAAAHEAADATDETRKHDDDIMMDDDEWN